MTEERIDTHSLFLTFRLEDEVFALDVSQVREILDITAITRVPGSSDFMRGVINVRGSVVPVVDLHLKFGMPAAEQTLDSRIVVMEIDLNGEMTVIGALADAVHDVMAIEPDQIEELPKTGSKWRSDFIKGVGKSEGRFVIILDVDRMFYEESPVTLPEFEDIPEAEMEVNAA